MSADSLIAAIEGLVPNLLQVPDFTPRQKGQHVTAAILQSIKFQEDAANSIHSRVIALCDIATTWMSAPHRAASSVSSSSQSEQLFILAGRCYFVC
jgi:hypothetical protein